MHVNKLLWIVLQTLSSLGILEALEILLVSNALMTMTVNSMMLPVELPVIIGHLYSVSQKKSPLGFSENFSQMVGNF